MPQLCDGGGGAGGAGDPAWQELTAGAPKHAGMLKDCGLTGFTVGSETEVG